NTSCSRDWSSDVYSSDLDVRPIMLRELIIGIVFAVIAIIYLKRSKLGKFSHVSLQILRTIWIARVIGTGKAKCIFSLIFLDRIIESRLTSERQQIDTLMP